VESHRRLVEHVEHVRRLVAASADVVSDLVYLDDELDALRVADRDLVTTDRA
jgi:hypothetical protein